jgi:hypothetical protein
LQGLVLQGQLEGFCSVADTLLIALDSTKYFSSGQMLELFNPHSEVWRDHYFHRSSRQSSSLRDNLRWFRWHPSSSCSKMDRRNRIVKTLLRNADCHSKGNTCVTRMLLFCVEDLYYAKLHKVRQVILTELRAPF